MTATNTAPHAHEAQYAEAVSACPVCTPLPDDSPVCVTCGAMAALTYSPEAGGLRCASCDESAARYAAAHLTAEERGEACEDCADAMDDTSPLTLADHACTGGACRCKCPANAALRALDARTARVEEPPVCGYCGDEIEEPGQTCDAGAPNGRCESLSREERGEVGALTCPTCLTPWNDHTAEERDEHNRAALRDTTRHQNADGAAHLAYFDQDTDTSYVWDGASPVIAVCPGGYGEPCARTIPAPTSIAGRGVHFSGVLASFRARCEFDADNVRRGFIR